MTAPAPFMLRAAARVEDGRLVIDYAVASTGGPALVGHLDYYYGRPHGVVGWLDGRLGASTAALFFGTVALPPYMNAAMPPRVASVLLPGGGTVQGTLALPLPLIETGAVVLPMPEPANEQVVPLQRMVVVVEVLPHDDGKGLPKAPGGGLDAFGRRGAREHVRTVIELPAGVSLRVVPGAVSTIVHALGK